VNRYIKLLIIPVVLNTNLLSSKLSYKEDDLLNIESCNQFDWCKFRNEKLYAQGFNLVILSDNNKTYYKAKYSGDKYIKFEDYQDDKSFFKYRKKLLKDYINNEQFQRHYKTGYIEYKYVKDYIKNIVQIKPIKSTEEIVQVKRVESIQNIDKATTIKQVDIQQVKLSNNIVKTSIFTLNNLIDMLVKQNTQLDIEKLEVEISKIRIDQDKGVFENNFFLEINKNHEYSKNNTQDTILKNYKDTYTENSYKIDVGFKGNSVYGTNWKVSAISEQKSSSLIDDTNKNSYEYTSGIYAEIKQPLLKGFGKKIGSSNINISKLKNKQSIEIYKQKIVETIGNAIIVYWKLYSAIEIEKTWKEIIALSIKQENIIKLKVESGNMSQIDLLEMQNSIIKSKVALLNATDRIQKEKMNLLSLLNISTLQNNKDFTPTDNPMIEEIQIPSLKESISLAKLNWIQLALLNQKIKQEKLVYDLSTDYLKPNLEFVGNIYSNSMEETWKRSVSNSVKDGYRSWYVGLNFEIPIQGNIQATSKQKQSKLKLNQLNMKKVALENNLINALNNKINNLDINKRKMLQLNKTLIFRDKMIEVYTNELKYGKVDVKKLIDAYQSRVATKREWLRGLMDIKLSQASLEIAIGTLLNKYNVKILDSND